jgi:bifunctional DNA-binding transcriptional regulator/antitoxin component of YhaV-PrlF toxin-antitoxin module
VGEFTSTVTIARPRSTSLRTTVPEGVAKLLDLKAGDEVTWTVKAIKGQVEVSVSKK